MKSKPSPDLNIAGKTGTTDDYRDSWFAGFSGNRLTVVLAGTRRQQTHRPERLQRRAPRVWMDLMAGLNLEPLDPPLPAGRGNPGGPAQRVCQVSQGCRGGQPVPFLAVLPRGSTSCGGRSAARRSKPRETAPDASEDAGSAGGMSDFFRRLME